MRRKIAAVLVHLYTASGALLAFGALVDLAGRHFSAAFLLLMIAFWVDYTDGTMARAVGVSAVIPLIDGTTLDHVIDFVTSAFLPVFLLWQADALPRPRWGWIAVILLSSLFRFSKTFNPWLTRGFFTGMPSPWINLAFYLYYYRLPEAASSGIIVLLVVLTFLPLGYIHVAMFGRWKLANVLALTAWWAIYLFITEGWVVDTRFWLHVSLIHPVFYVATSWYFAAQLKEQDPTR